MPKQFKLICASATMLAAAFLSTSAVAQKLAGITAEPANVVQGATVKVTVNIDVMSGINCGLRLHWGDGAADDVKINQKKDVPWIASHLYTKAGNYEVKAEPKTQGALMPRCGGDNQIVKVTVTAPPAPEKAAIPKATTVGATAPVNPCPEGWKLSKAGVNKASKAFTCTAAANTKLPEQRLACPGNLDYFENSKKGHLGCKA